MRTKLTIVVVVRLPRLMKGKGLTQIFSSLQKLPVPPQAVGVVGILNFVLFLVYFWYSMDYGLIFGP